MNVFQLSAKDMKEKAIYSKAFAQTFTGLLLRLGLLLIAAVLLSLISQAQKAQ
jgi:hypothetical protein